MIGNYSSLNVDGGVLTSPVAYVVVNQYDNFTSCTNSGISNYEITAHLDALNTRNDAGVSNGWLIGVCNQEEGFQYGYSFTTHGLLTDEDVKYSINVHLMMYEFKNCTSNRFVNKTDEFGTVTEVIENVQDPTNIISVSSYPSDCTAMDSAESVGSTPASYYGSSPGDAFMYSSYYMQAHLIPLHTLHEDIPFHSSMLFPWKKPNETYAAGYYLSGIHYDMTSCTQDANYIRYYWIRESFCHGDYTYYCNKPTVASSYVPMMAKVSFAVDPSTNTSNDIICNDPLATTNIHEYFQSAKCVETVVGSKSMVTSTVIVCPWDTSAMGYDATNGTLASGDNMMGGTENSTSAVVGGNNNTFADDDIPVLDSMSPSGTPTEAPTLFQPTNPTSAPSGSRTNPPTGVPSSAPSANITPEPRPINPPQPTSNPTANPPEPSYAITSIFINEHACMNFEHVLEVVGYPLKTCITDYSGTSYQYVAVPNRNGVGMTITQLLYADNACQMIKQDADVTHIRGLNACSDMLYTTKKYHMYASSFTELVYNDSMPWTTYLSKFAPLSATSDTTSHLPEFTINEKLPEHSLKLDGVYRFSYDMTDGYSCISRSKLDADTLTDQPAPGPNYQLDYNFDYIGSTWSWTPLHTCVGGYQYACNGYDISEMESSTSGSVSTYNITTKYEVSTSKEVVVTEYDSNTCDEQWKSWNYLTYVCQECIETNTQHCPSYSDSNIHSINIDLKQYGTYMCVDRTAESAALQVYLRGPVEPTWKEQVYLVLQEPIYVGVGIGMLLFCCFYPVVSNILCCQCTCSETSKAKKKHPISSVSYESVPNAALDDVVDSMDDHDIESRHRDSSIELTTMAPIVTNPLNKDTNHLDASVVGTGLSIQLPPYNPNKNKKKKFSID